MKELNPYSRLGNQVTALLGQAWNTKVEIADFKVLSCRLSMVERLSFSGGAAAAFQVQAGTARM
ncbi:hypothetical protein [Paenibacillus caui]|uniref:hypothetical protein n=1 Tax=Paenibacillus caui TaxID=2873927 RepID=UPI001CA7F38C|nr:hypothetical protein [Paenibacillus caui]